MSWPPRRARRRDLRSAPWRLGVAVACFALAIVLLSWLVNRGVSSALSSLPAQGAASESANGGPIVLTGHGSRTSASFYLAGGGYRSEWAAWGESPDDPPCFHSAQLVATDQTPATSGPGLVTELAHVPSVPATGTSDQRYVPDVKAGHYYLDVKSACAWQVALTPV